MILPSQKVFSYVRPLTELDMRLELPWSKLRSSNPASLADLFVGFIHYYANDFDFTQWAVSVRHGGALPIDMAIRRLPPHEQAHNARNFKVFVEGMSAFSLSPTTILLSDIASICFVIRLFVYRTVLSEQRCSVVV